MVCRWSRGRLENQRTMNLPKVLGIARRELNLLYTRPPSAQKGGWDEGWFGREQAYHTFFLLRLLGEDAAIEIGHFAVCADSASIASYGGDTTHAWCSIPGVAPIDLSMTFRHRLTAPQLAGPIIGCATKNGEYSVYYCQDTPSFEAWLDAPLTGPSIGFLATDAPVPEWTTLLDRPETFFLPSHDGGPLHLYGPEIFCRITMHVYKVVQGHVPPLAGKSDARSAFQHIRSKYQSSRLKIHRMLAAAK